MTKKQPPLAALPISVEQLTRLQTAVDDFSSHQLAWLSGYLWGVVNQNTQVDVSASTLVVTQDTVTIISASQTGNARRLSEQLRERLVGEKISVNLVNAGDYKFKQINQEQVLVIVASTQGEGEPAEEAVALYNTFILKKRLIYHKLAMRFSRWETPLTKNFAKRVKISILSLHH